MIEKTKICDFEVWKEIRAKSNSRFLILHYKKIIIKKNKKEGRRENCKTVLRCCFLSFHFKILSCEFFFSGKEVYFLVK